MNADPRAYSELLAAARRVTAAFRAHGDACGFIFVENTRKECEAAMLALDVAVIAAEQAA